MSMGYENVALLSSQFVSAVSAEALKAYDCATKQVKAKAEAVWNSLPTVTLDDVTGYLNKGKKYITGTELYKGLSERACKAYDTGCTYCTMADTFWGTVAKWGLGTALVTTYLIPHTFVIGMGLGLGMAYGGYKGVNQTVPQKMEQAELHQRLIKVIQEHPNLLEETEKDKILLQLQNA
ncbi:hypothetical protein [Endozoicomonas sp.]|uniref:hypothetical protein n=1 Tax=Endozoicomonas sp. TaxID=1892382 RepID=UPI003AF8D551